ncbi:MAG: phosphoribosylamine--glycine ligase [Gemmatimonadota bacterium]
MKILVVGSGAREHALAWKLRRDDPTTTILAAPGNPGIASLGRCVPVKATDLPGLLQLARDQAVDLTVVGPEAPLAAGIVDLFQHEKLTIFGPTQAAAQIESSKRFGKELMVKAGVPTAHASWHRDSVSAKRAAHALGAPLVIKASGLAAGKGVVVCATLYAAEQAIDQMLEHGIHGEAGAEVLVEEFMEGEEVSIFAITDGESFVTLLPIQDHKRLNEGDLGPNTGGMGAYAPVSIATPELIEETRRTIFAPTLAALQSRGTPFSGLLYAGLMLTPDGPKVVEFNCRFGDPETEAILPLFTTSLTDHLWAAARGERGLSQDSLSWSNACGVTTVVAAAGYPETPHAGDRITLPPSEDDVFVFHAGTAVNASGDLVTAGGRVVAVTAIDADFEAAAQRSAATADAVNFAGRQYRRDIGWRELSRRARVTGN